VVIGAIGGAVWYFLPNADSTTAVEVKDVYGRAASDVIEVTYGTCGREGSKVYVDETDTTITVTVRLDWTATVDCLDDDTTAALTLDQKLGERTVIDGSSGEPIEVEIPLE